MTTRVLRPSMAIALGALLAAALSPLIADGDAARPDLSWAWVTIPAVLLMLATVVASARAARSGSRAPLIVVASVTAAAAVVAGWLFVVDAATGTPGALSAVVAGCLLVAAVALLTAALRPPTAEGAAAPPVNDSLAGGGARAGVVWSALGIPVTAGVLLGVGALVAPIAVNSAAHSSTAAAVGDLPAAPELPTAAAWSVDGPEARHYFVRGGVVPAGAGFVTARGYPGAPAPGLAGVDGSTGTLRWTYALARAIPVGLAASPDGRHVVTVFSPDTGADIANARRLVVLDAVTGEPLWSTTVHRQLDDAHLAPTNDVLPIFADDVVPAGDADTLLGLDLATGDVRWEAGRPADCRWMFTVATSTATASLQSMTCEDRTARLVALDEGSGVEQWRYVTDVAEVGGRSGDTWGVLDMISADPGGTVIRLVREVAGLDDPITVVLRADGSVLATGKENRWVMTRGPVPIIEGPRKTDTVSTDGREPTVEVTSLMSALPLDGGEPVPLDLGGWCPGSALATTTTAVISACNDGSMGDPPWQVRTARVDGTGEPGLLGDVQGRPQAVVIGPGAAVMVTSDDGVVRYYGYR